MGTLSDYIKQQQKKTYQVVLPADSASGLPKDTLNMSEAAYNAYMISLRNKAQKANEPPKMTEEEKSIYRLNFQKVTPTDPFTGEYPETDIASKDSADVYQKLPEYTPAHIKAEKKQTQQEKTDNEKEANIKEFMTLMGQQPWSISAKGGKYFVQDSKGDDIEIPKSEYDQYKTYNDLLKRRITESYQKATGQNQPKPTLEQSVKAYAEMLKKDPNLTPEERQHKVTAFISSQLK